MRWTLQMLSFGDTSVIGCSLQEVCLFQFNFNGMQTCQAKEPEYNMDDGIARNEADANAEDMRPLSHTANSDPANERPC